MFCAVGESRRLTVVRGIGIALLLQIYLVLVSGCATAPSASATAAEDYLVPDQSAYFGVNVAANRELVSYVAASLGAEADVIVNRIDLFAGSLDLAPAGDSASSGTPEISGVALGRFPKGATRFALWKDRGFRRSVSEIVYYRQVEGPLELAIPESGIILVSTGSVVGLVRETRAIESRLDPRTAEWIRSVGGQGSGLAEGPDIVIVLPDPGSVLTGPLGLDLPGFPILRLSLAVTVVPTDTDTGIDSDPVADAGTTADQRPVPAERLELSGEFGFSSEMQAALFERLGRVFVIGFVRALGLETTNLRENAGYSFEIEAHGTELRFQGVTMSPVELVGLVVRLTGRQ